jgi:hypothetical protein
MLHYLSAFVSLKVETDLPQILRICNIADRSLDIEANKGETRFNSRPVEYKPVIKSSTGCCVRRARLALTCERVTVMGAECVSARGNLISPHIERLFV